MLSLYLFIFSLAIALETFDAFLFLNSYHLEEVGVEKCDV